LILVPEAQRAETFKGLFIHGALFHIQDYRFEDYTGKDKFLLVMRGLATDGNCYFYLPTSKVDQYRSNPVFRNSLYVFPNKSIVHFPVETAIVIANCRHRPYQLFEGRYINQPVGKDLVFLDFIPQEHMEAICAMVHDSEEISDFHKRQLIPPQAQKQD